MEGAVTTGIFAMMLVIFMYTRFYSDSVLNAVFFPNEKSILYLQDRFFVGEEDGVH